MTNGRTKVVNASWILISLLNLHLISLIPFMLMAERGISFPKSDYTCYHALYFLMATEIYITGLIQYPYCTVCSVGSGTWIVNPH